MKTMKTSELIGAALDWAVAQATGFDNGDWLPDYSTEWCHGGAIIEREQINIVLHYSGKYWQAASEEWMLTDGYPSVGETPLIAAMRCYVESELGDEVEVPDELINYA